MSKIQERYNKWIAERNKIHAFLKEHNAEYLRQQRQINVNLANIRYVAKKQGIVLKEEIVKEKE